MIPPMTRTPIRTTRRVAESLALGAMTALLAANSGPMPLEEVKRERFRPPRAGILCARASSIGGCRALSTRASAGAMRGSRRVIAG